jgi:hypothetical protein
MIPGMIGIIQDPFHGLNDVKKTMNPPLAKPDFNALFSLFQENYP